MDFFAPNCFANVAAIIFLLSTGPTAMNRLAFDTSALARASNVVASPVMVTMSENPLMFSMFLGSSSMTVMSCISSPSMRAKWLPTSPTPAITIFMIIKNSRMTTRHEFCLYLQIIIESGHAACFVSVHGVLASSHENVSRIASGPIIFTESKIRISRIQKQTRLVLPKAEYLRRSQRYE